MAACKRILGATGSDPDQNQKEKRLRTSPSFRSVIVEVMRVRCFQGLFESLEPLLRRVVNEEVDRALKHSLLTLSRSPSLRIKGADQLQPSNLKLIFSNQLSLPIFTGSKIHDCDKNPLRILLVREQDSQTHHENLSSPVKIELVAIDGDFCTDRSSWSGEEFKDRIIKERAGKRPLLAGELVYTMRDGFVTVGEIEFTDNSSWIRGRKFRVGARMAAETSNGVRILEAVSEAFVVKDHRGELYKKHYPPMLNDKVWRLEKIGKDGTFHKKLEENGINTVQDFLKLSNVDPTHLRAILGQGMSDKMWEVTIKHARTCKMDNKFYVLRGQDHCVSLSSTCEVICANICGTLYTPSHDSTLSIKAHIRKLVKLAYDNWDSLEEVEPPTTAQLASPPRIMDQPYTSNWTNQAQMLIQRPYLGLPAQNQTGMILDGPPNLGPQFNPMNLEMGSLYFSNNTSFENLPDSN